MRVVMFYHSLISDWNHGNAHFLRGVVSELRARGHEVIVYEPALEEATFFNSDVVQDLEARLAKAQALMTTDALIAPVVSTRTPLKPQPSAILA